MSLQRSSVIVALALALGGSQRTTSADWPQARHDPRRTAQAAGLGDITQPVAYWKRYLGGELDAAAFLLADVDRDTVGEVLMITGGSAVAVERSDSTIWRSPNLELTAFLGLADLDGDGGDELVVRSLSRVFVLDPRDGAVLWAEAAGEMGTIGGARLGDVDGDGLSDLVVQECACCAVVGDNAGFVYSFASGLARPTRLWELPFARCAGESSLTLVDADGRAPLEVVAGDVHEIVLLDGRTGRELARSPSLGLRLQESHCVPVDIDRQPGQELVCAREASFTPAERGVFALRYTGAALEMVWSKRFAAVEGGAIQWVDLVDDLDDNGTPEVVVSASPDATAWTTYVMSAASGGATRTIPGEVVSGLAPADGGGSILLTSSETHLSGWRYTAGPTLDLDWTVLDAAVPQTLDLERAGRSSVAMRAVVARVDGDDIPDVVTELRSAPGTLVGYSVSGGQVTELARFQLPASVRPQQFWPLASATDSHLHLALARNDGFLTLLGEGLQPARYSSDDVGEAKIRTGGYYASGWRRIDNTPRAARLGDGPDRILIEDSRGSVVVLDAELGSFAAPPRALWEVPGGSAPAVVDRLDGDRPGVACLAVDQPVATPPSFSVLALGGRGDLLWRQPAPARPLNDIVPGRFDADGVPDLVFQWGDPGDVLLRTRALSGADGHTLWDAEPVDPGAGRKPAGVAVARFNGDGFDDVYHQVQRTQVLSGATGGELAASGAGAFYFMPTLVNLDGDERDEIVLHGGPEPVSVLSHDLGTTLFVSPDDNRPFPYGAVADCQAGRQVLIEGSNLYPARLKLTDLSSASVGQERTVVLAGGGLFASEAAAREGAGFLGQLTSATVHQDLTGREHPSAVVGSTDGFLYAIDPCAGRLDFSYSFGAAVGEAIFADTDGDGRDEILVTVEDGYLYTLRQFEIDPPDSVIDTDPFSDRRDDIAELETHSTLEANWAPVLGASRYQVSVVDESGAYVGTPWQDAGTETSLLLTDLPLVDDAIYRVSVRAVRSDGHHSVNTVSNGVWVHLVAEEESPDHGCGCRAAPTRGDAAWLLLLATALLALLKPPRRQEKIGR